MGTRLQVAASSCAETAGCGLAGGRTGWDGMVEAQRGGICCSESDKLKCEVAGQSARNQDGSGLQRRGVREWQ